MSKPECLTKCQLLSQMCKRCWGKSNGTLYRGKPDERLQREKVSTKNTYLQPQNLPPTSAAAKQQGGNWLINSQFMPLMTDFY